MIMLNDVGINQRGLIGNYSHQEDSTFIFFLFILHDRGDCGGTGDRMHHHFRLREPVLSTSCLPTLLDDPSTLCGLLYLDDPPWLGQTHSTCVFLLLLSRTGHPIHPGQDSQHRPKKGGDSRSPGKYTTIRFVSRHVLSYLQYV